MLHGLLFTAVGLCDTKACYRKLNIHQACRAGHYVSLNGRFPSAWSDLSPWGCRCFDNMSRVVWMLCIIDPSQMGRPHFHAFCCYKEYGRRLTRFIQDLDTSSVWLDINDSLTVHPLAWAVLWIDSPSFIIPIKTCGRIYQEISSI